MNSTEKRKLKKVLDGRATVKKIGNVWLSYSSIPGSFWFRIFGYGLVIKDVKIHPPLFSDRMGITKPLQIGKYSIKIIKPKTF